MIAQVSIERKDLVLSPGPSLVKGGCLLPDNRRAFNVVAQTSSWLLAGATYGQQGLAAEWLLRRIQRCECNPRRKFRRQKEASNGGERAKKRCALTQCFK
jgi:hypothetical protein